MRNKILLVFVILSLAIGLGSCTDTKESGGIEVKELTADELRRESLIKATELGSASLAIEVKRYIYDNPDSRLTPEILDSLNVKSDSISRLQIYDVMKNVERK
jgi:hypothetical protein